MKKFQSSSGQDKWVLDTLDNKRDGYFVDIGASSGIVHSNSYALEKCLGWIGICVEPNPNSRAFPRLKKNRNCICENVCIYSKNTEVDFVARGRRIETSGICGPFESEYIEFQVSNKHPIIKVPAITLLELLKKNDAPSTIDYLSIDTEGSEWEILKDFDFSKYTFLTMTVENNYNEEDKVRREKDKVKRDRIRELLQNNGYILKKQLWFGEDWFIYDQHKFHSDMGQDKWVLDTLDNKRNGYFVDIGASNGISGNNTYVLEKYFNWTGICVEPNPKLRAFPTLKKNRNCICENVCIYSENTEVDFMARGSLIGYSGIPGPFATDCIKKKPNHPLIKVPAITLMQLLEQNNAPSVIDYISIDTEGTEWEVLKNFDFDKYTFLTMTVEHNYIERKPVESYKIKRDKIRELLEKNGYIRKKLSAAEKKMSEWEDWFTYNY